MQEAGHTREAPIQESGGFPGGSLKRCTFCDKSERCLVCKFCRSPAYCSTRCTFRDWKRHGPICRETRVFRASGKMLRRCYAVFRKLIQSHQWHDLVFGKLLVERTKKLCLVLISRKRMAVDALESMIRGSLLRLVLK